MSIEIEYLEEAPTSRGGFRAVWKTDLMKKTIEKILNKVKNGGKKIVGIPVEQAWAEWHGGELGKHASFYLRKKIIEVLEDELGVKGAQVYTVTVGGKKRVIINLTDAEF